MKKMLLLFVMGIFLSTNVIAGTPIDLLIEDDSSSVIVVNSDEISDDMVSYLNDNVYIKTMIKGYDAIGIKVEDSFYKVDIQDNRIHTITHSIMDSDVDYTIETNLAEMIYVFSNYNTMSKVEMMRTLVMEKDVPVSVILNLASVFMGEI